MQLTNYLNGSVTQLEQSAHGTSTLEEKIILTQMPFEKAQSSKKNEYIKFNLPLSKAAPACEVKGFVHADFTFSGKLYSGTGESIQELKGRYYYNDHGIIIKAFWLAKPHMEVIMELTWI